MAKGVDMLKERRAVVEDIQGQLLETEIAVEAAITSIGRLAILLPDARIRARVSPVAGQAAFENIGAAMAKIVDVRGHMVAAHEHLEQARADFRMPELAAGGGYEKPPRDLVKGGLSVVSAAAA
jgi:hypothetical protein